MIDDVIKLISIRYEPDEEGNQIPIEYPRTVFCRVSSIGRTEFYQAAQIDMHPNYVFRLSNFRDYRGESKLLYRDHTGIEKCFSIIRTYRNPDSDMLELTVEEDIGDGNSDKKHRSRSDECS